MSKGTRVVPVRLDPTLVERIEAAVKSKNATIFEEEWTFSRWVRDACWEKLAHLGAAKKQREKRGQQTREKRRLAELGRLLQS